MAWVAEITGVFEDARHKRRDDLQAYLNTSLDWLNDYYARATDAIRTYARRPNRRWSHAAG